MVYVNVIKQNNPVSYYNAKHKIDALIKDANDNKDYENNSYIFDNYTIDKISIIDQEDKIVLLEFKIKTGSKSYIVNSLIPFKDD